VTVPTEAFDLNVVKVLDHWTATSAIREVVANALDESALTATGEPVIEKDAEGVWHIRDFGRGLRYAHLTQNENAEKLKHPELVIGKFGIGLKDALAVFDRKQLGVLIRSRHGDMTLARLPKHGFSDLVTLHVVVAPPSDPAMRGTDVAMAGLKDVDVEDAKDLFLRYAGDPVLERTGAGAVLARSKGKPARIYVNGLRVATEDRFLFSYDITSMTATLRRALNRERTNVGRTAYTDRVKAILLAADSAAVVDPLIADLAKFDLGTIHDETEWLDVGVHACQILNAREKVLFVAPHQISDSPAWVERARQDGYRVVLVPMTLLGRLPKVKDVAGGSIVDLGTFAERWNDSFDFRFVEAADLPPAERAVYELTADIIRLQGRRPPGIRAIKISETMRINAEGTAEAVGYWDPVVGQIVVKRDQLHSLSTYAGTLLHELSHARSDAPDVSSEFEAALTATLGSVADRSLESAAATASTRTV
jgi:hypothetical protein